MARRWLLGFVALVAGCAHPYGDDPSTVVTASESATPAPPASVEKDQPPVSAPTTSSSDDTHAGAGVTPAPSGSFPLELSWNRVSPTAKYSLDVQLTNNQWIPPCVGVTTLSHRLAWKFDGHCVTPDTTISWSDMKELRICSAEDDDWPNAICTNANWDGVSTKIAFDN
jgi:hypothetical protein